MVFFGGLMFIGRISKHIPKTFIWQPKDSLAGYEGHEGYESQKGESHEAHEGHEEESREPDRQGRLLKTFI